jgi:hypothetical protein
VSRLALLTIAAADLPNRQISLQTDQGDLYSIKVLPEAKVQRIALTKAEPIEIGTIAKGDRILARGQQDAAAKTLLAGQIIVIPKQSLKSRDAARQQEWTTGALAGVVKTVNALTIQAKGNFAWTIDTAGVKAVHQYADDSSKFANAGAAELTELQPGDQLKVLGPRDTESKTVKAAEIVFGRFTTMGGETKSIDAANESLTVYDLSTKKNITTQVSREARMTRLPGSSGGGSPGFGPRGAAPNGPQGAGPRGPGFGSARADRIRGLEQGADDYLPKSFAPEELLARIRALESGQREAGAPRCPDSSRPTGSIASRASPRIRQ